MDIEFSNLKDTEKIFSIFDKENFKEIKLTKKECYALFVELKKMFPIIKAPESIDSK